MECTVVMGRVETSLGILGAACTPRGIARLTFASEPFAHCEAWVRRWLPEARIIDDGACLGDLQWQLKAYLAGDLRGFDLPLDLRGTPFQLQAWRAVAAIPYGETRSYAQIAAAIGRPTAVRAVGAANGANPVPIIVPCHRVIGSGGALVGFGGGLDLKRRLLALEGAGLTRPSRCATA